MLLAAYPKMILLSPVKLRHANYLIFIIMTHYVCPACGGVADHPKVCETAGCSREGHELAACDCTDNKHRAVMDQTAPAGDTIPEAS